MNSEHLNVAWLGPSRRPESQDLIAALAAESIHVETVDAARELFDNAASIKPRAILLNAAMDDAADACLTIRMQASLALVPVVWLERDLDDLVFAEAFGVGGDDVARIDAHHGIIRRIKGLPSIEDKGPRASRGVALLGEADDQRRVVLARLLRNAGFDVSFAGRTGELSERLETDEPALVVADLDLPDDGVMSVFRAWRAEGGQAPWIIATPPKKLLATSEALRSERGASVWDAYAPPENVLYAANEALRGSFAEQRASPRLLYGTKVAFRVAGRESDDHGYLYNVSGEGVFIRTLAPLGPGEDAWLEFKPPRTDRLIRLEASVVWRKAFGRVSEATVPPGFGARITGGSANDVHRYRDGYRALAEQFAGIRFSAHPPRA